VKIPAQVQPPLHAEVEPGAGSGALVDDRNRLVKLAGVNWYGAESQDEVPGGLDKQSVNQIAEQIKGLGFNSVRLPFSNYIVECNPLVKKNTASANPGFEKLHVLEVFDRVVAGLAKQGLMVILDDHSSDPTWSPDPTDALWYVKNSYSPEQWIKDWVAMAQRYRGVPSVIGADLRNEPNGRAQWGTGGDAFDWRKAAERAGNAILSSSGNPSLLVMVEGIHFGVDLSGVAQDPICLQPGEPSAYSRHGPCPPSAATGSLVYAPHDYTEFQAADINSDPKSLIKQLGVEDGWAVAAAAAPLWIGEFGTCNTSPRCVKAPADSRPSENCANTENSGPVGTWFANFTRYVSQRDFSWTYWPLNGTQSPPRNPKKPECYGLLDPEWKAQAPAAADLVCALQSMIDPSAATYPADGCTQSVPTPPAPVAGGAVTSTGPTAPICGRSPCGTTNGVTVMITSVKRSPTNGYGQNLTHQGQFLARMGVRIINEGNRSITIDNAHFALLDSQHIVDETSDEGFGSRCGLTGNGDPGLTLAPGADVTMPESLCFEPRGSVTSPFVVALGLDSGEEVDVRVP
jgi:endoglucanase